MAEGEWPIEYQDKFAFIVSFLDRAALLGPWRVSVYFVPTQETLLVHLKGGRGTFIFKLNGYMPL